MPRAANLLILGLPAVGFVLGSAAWLTINAVSSGPTAIAELGARLEGAAAPSRRRQLGASAAVPDAAYLIAYPVLKLTGGQAGTEPRLRLEGIALTPTGGSALLAIDDAPAIWLHQGESRLGVTLRRVDRTRVTLESFSGEHDVTLGAGQGEATRPASMTGFASATSTPPSP